MTSNPIPEKKKQPAQYTFSQFFIKKQSTDQTKQSLSHKMLTLIFNNHIVIKTVKTSYETVIKSNKTVTKSHKTLDAYLLQNIVNIKTVIIIQV